MKLWQWIFLAISGPPLLAGVIAWIGSLWRRERRQTAETLSRLHHLPREEYAKYVEGWDAEAVSRAKEQATPVVPPNDYQPSPHWHRRN